MSASEALRQTAEQGPNSPASPELGWMQQALANCYFRFRLPALMRPVRDHYQLAVSRGRKWPGLSLEKRTVPSARILYYHRVNDDGDPFFPAIGTSLFEAEMRFVSKHYRVVSLTELVERLAEGSVEPVLAITFDDGYRDNYDLAFPILQRYGLPATIFLTTGSMDSREPLWFEQIALAFKKTTRQSADLDIDPRSRFWMRTTVERLQCVDRAFAIFRGLPDAERRQSVARTLQQLGARDEGERDGKMLGWDQVRFMKDRGIDFGGHTVTHPFLSRMSGDRVAWEASECKRRIEDEMQSPARHFAYPNGRDEDFGQWNKDLIRRAGYRAAVTTIWGVNNQSTDPMELRRGGPWETSPAAFAYKLDWYQLVNG